MDDPAALRIECEPVGLGTRARLIVRNIADNKPLDVDTLDLGRAADRAAYARRAASLLPWSKADFEAALLGIAAQRLTQRQVPEPPLTLGDALTAWASTPDVPRVETGFRPLDELLGGGLPHGTLTVIAGQPSAGKSALALQVTLGALLADAGLRAVWGLGEMTTEALARRAVAVGSVLLGGDAAVTMTQAGRRSQAAKTIADELRHDLGDRLTIVAPLTIDRIEAAVRATGARLVVVDYLQLCRVDGAADRRQEVDAVVRGLREMTLTHGLALVAVSNVAKGVGRDSRIGQLGKESAEIDFAADLFLLGEPAADEDENGLRQVKWRCMKNRHGSARDIEVTFDGGLQVFTVPEAEEFEEFAGFAPRVFE